jgi:N-acetylglucosamine kinase-like BadF-type ATPase
VGLVVAVDGGNSKTHLVAATTEGEIVAERFGPGSNSHAVGAAGTAWVIRELAAGLEPELAACFLCGADGPDDVAELERELAGIAPAFIVENDTWALLRAGTDREDAVAVICGSGINVLGRAANGREARYPSLGWETGDWGGGEMLGRDAIFLAARAEDGRGAPTALAGAIREHFGAPSVEAVGAGFHYRRLPASRIGEVAPLVGDAAASGDEVARGLVERLAGEIVLMVERAFRDLAVDDADVVLGGGMLQDTTRPLLAALVRERLAHAIVLDVPPVLGAMLAALDAAGAGANAKIRVRRELGG